MERRAWIQRVVGAGVVGALATAGIVTSEYGDVFGFDDDYRKGRTKNAIAAVIAGVIGQKMYGASSIDMLVGKKLWPDAKLTGHTTSTSIDTEVDLLLTGVHFIARANDAGYMEGRCRKSEFDWKIEQISAERYEVGRWGPKLDGELRISVAGGQISGTFVRRGLAFDWDVKGRYNNQGDVYCVVDGPLNLAITLEGTVTPYRAEQE